MRSETVDTTRDWHVWFAWYPIWIDIGRNRGVWIFWEKVQRRIRPCYDGVNIEIRNLDGSYLHEKA